jgi:hypothetical protein
VNGKSTLIGAFVNSGKSTYIGTSDPRGRHSDPSGNVPCYLRVEAFITDHLRDYAPCLEKYEAVEFFPCKKIKISRIANFLVVLFYKLKKMSIF